MQRNNGEAKGVDKVLQLNLWCEELKLNVFLHAGTWTAVLHQNTVSLQLLGHSMTRGLEAKRGDDCNAVVQFFVLFCFCTLKSLKGL